MSHGLYIDAWHLFGRKSDLILALAVSVPRLIVRCESCRAAFTKSFADLEGRPLTRIFTASLSALEPDEFEQSRNLAPIHPEYIQRGADVLALFQDMSRFRRFTQRWFDLSESSIVLQPVFRIWQEEMWNVHKDVLTEAKPDELYALSEMVWRNTRRPVVFNGQMTYSEWAASSTGNNLRWEVIGMILACVGIVAGNLSDWDSIFDDIRDDIVDRVTFSERMRNASELVLCFCYECETLNDLYICFIYEGLCLIELLKGDSRKFFSMPQLSKNKGDGY